MNKRIIYDFGANKGQNIPYFLLKSDLVVAVEANKSLCDKMGKQFRSAIESGNLIIVNKALYVPADGETLPDTVTLHIPKQSCKQGLGDEHSTLVRPENLSDSFFRDPAQYDSVKVRASTPLDIVAEYGCPYYIKIDVEHYDHHILRSLLDGNVFPAYLSSECHNIEVLKLMLSCEMYEEYKLLSGADVGCSYKEARISNDLERYLPNILRSIVTRIPFMNPVLTTKYEFKRGSSGPFGEDIQGAWMDADEISSLLTSTGLGWVDLHAKRRA